MRPKVLACTLLLLTATLVAIASAGTSQPGLPTIIVDVEDMDDVETDPVEYNHVHATATVTVENFLLGAMVNINATTDNFWLVTVTPNKFTLAQGSGNRVENIDVDIRVPPKASADIPVTLTVYANATAAVSGLEYEDDDHTTITVEHYYGLRVTTNGTLSAEQGRNYTHRMRVTNTGNGKDNFTVTLTNQATLLSKGMEFEFVADAYDVGADRTHSVVIQVTMAEDAAIGTEEALFSVASQGDPSQTVTYRLTITVREGTSTNGGNGGDGDGDDEDSPGFAAIGSILAVALLAALLLARRPR